MADVKGGGERQVVGTLAHNVVETAGPGDNPVKIGGKAVASFPPAVVGDLDRVDAMFSVQGELFVRISDGATSASMDGGSGGLRITGDIDHDLPDNGRPMKVGGVATAAPATAVSTDGDRVDASFDLEGRQRVNTGAETSTAVLGALNDAVTISSHVGPLVSFEIRDTGSLTSSVLSFEASVDGTNWFGVAAMGIDVRLGDSINEASLPSRGFIIENGWLQVRIRLSTWTSGSATATMVASNGSPGSIATFGNVGNGVADVGPPIKTGGKAESTTPTAVADGERVDGWYDLLGRQNVQLTADAVPASDDLVKKEDDAAGGGDAGIAVFAVRRAAATGSAGTEADYQQLESDNSGRLWTNTALNDGTGTAVAFGGGVQTSNTLRVTQASDDLVRIEGNVDHDVADTAGPVKMGAKAISHGTDPSEVAANDRTDLFADRQGMPFGMLGHPNVIVREYMTTAAQTNDPIIDTVGAAQRVVILMISAVASAAGTTTPQVRIGFGTTVVPAEPASGASVTGMVLSHGGVAAGSGIVKGTGGARVAVGGLDQELRITNAVPTGGKITVEVHYYIIDE